MSRCGGASRNGLPSERRPNTLGLSGQGERLEMTPAVFWKLVARLDFGLYGFRWLRYSPAFAPRKDPIQVSTDAPTTTPTGSGFFVHSHFSDHVSLFHFALAFELPFSPQCRRELKTDLSDRELLEPFGS